MSSLHGYAMWVLISTIIFNTPAIVGNDASSQWKQDRTRFIRQWYDASDRRPNYYRPSPPPPNSTNAVMLRVKDGGGCIQKTNYHRDRYLWLNANCNPSDPSMWFTIEKSWLMGGPVQIGVGTEQCLSRGEFQNRHYDSVVAWHHWCKHDDRDETQLLQFRNEFKTVLRDNNRVLCLDARGDQRHLRYVYFHECNYQSNQEWEIIYLNSSAPLGETGCSTNYDMCWRYCGGNSGSWCYTAKNCKESGTEEVCRQYEKCGAGDWCGGADGCVETCEMNWIQAPKSNPTGSTGCSGKNSRCWRYCEGSSGEWCYTSIYCSGNDTCMSRTECEGLNCHGAAEGCVKMCPANNRLPIQKPKQDESTSKPFHKSHESSPSPTGTPGCWDKNGRCWRYCEGRKGTWCYTGGSNCVRDEDSCASKTKCKVMGCEGEGGCVDKCATRTVKNPVEKAHESTSRPTGTHGCRDTNGRCWRYCKGSSGLWCYTSAETCTADPDRICSGKMKCRDMGCHGEGGCVAECPR